MAGPCCPSPVSPCCCPAASRSSFLRREHSCLRTSRISECRCVIYVGLGSAGSFTSCSTTAFLWWRADLDRYSLFVAGGIPPQRGKGLGLVTFFVSGLTGFGSFLCYLGYGYLDTWHGIATLLLLPVFILGMWRSYYLIQGDRSIVALWTRSQAIDFRSRYGIGLLCLVFTGLGMMGAGVVIMVVGMTTVFVPEDLIYMQLTASQIGLINPHLIPLIAHDRAGFGGGLFSTGVLVFLIALHAKPAPHLWQALALAGTTGFVCAISVHFCIGYLVFSHIAPAFAGAVLFLMGLALTYRDCFGGGKRENL